MDTTFNDCEEVNLQLEAICHIVHLADIVIQLSEGMMVHRRWEISVHWVRYLPGTNQLLQFLRGSQHSVTGNQDCTPGMFQKEKVAGGVFV